MDRIDLTDEINFDDGRDHSNDEWYGLLEDKPEIEQQLFQLQDQYFSEASKIKKQKIFGEMLILTKQYARSFYLQKIRGNKYVLPEDVTEVATSAAIAFMSQYIYRSNFYVGASFGRMLDFKVKEQKSKKEQAEKTESLNQVIGDANDGKELEDFQYKVNFKNLYNEDMSVEDEVLRMTEKEVLKQCLDDYDKGVNYNPKQMLLSRFWLAILLRKPRNKHGKQSFIDNVAKATKYRWPLQQFELEIYNRLKQNAYQ